MLRVHELPLTLVLFILLFLAPQQPYIIRGLTLSALQHVFNSIQFNSVGITAFHSVIVNSNLSCKNTFEKKMVVHRFFFLP